jgi:spermidine synthase
MEEKTGPAQPMRTHTVLLLLFTASGCAALVYEIVWFHLLRLVIGASALSLGILLASFMGGMFLGSLLLARVVPVAVHPLRAYAFIEIGIGAFGVVLPFLLPAVRAVYIGLFGHGVAGIALRGMVAAILLLPPTALMGATLPAVARRYRGQHGGTSSPTGTSSSRRVLPPLSILPSASRLCVFRVARRMTTKLRPSPSPRWQRASMREPFTK